MRKEKKNGKKEKGKKIKKNQPSAELKHQFQLESTEPWFLRFLKMEN